MWPNASNFTVSNCTFKNGLFAGQQGFGLLVNYGTSNKYIITQNIFQSNTIQGLRDDGQGVNKIVKDNL